MYAKYTSNYRNYPTPLPVTADNATEALRNGPQGGNVILAYSHIPTPLREGLRGRTEPVVM